MWCGPEADGKHCAFVVISVTPPELFGITQTLKSSKGGLLGSGTAVSLLPITRRDQQASIQPLRQNRIGHLHEPGDIRAIDIVDGAIRAFAMLYAVGVDLLHDHVQAFVNIGVAARTGAMRPGSSPSRRWPRRLYCWHG